jgi:hypothetical protein
MSFAILCIDSQKRKEPGMNNGEMNSDQFLNGLDYFQAKVGPDLTLTMMTTFLYSTWRGEETRHPKAGGRSFAIMPTASPGSIFRRSASGVCSTAC